MPDPSATPSRRAPVTGATLGLILTLTLALFSVNASGARNSTVLGKTKSTPRPLCPKNCRATGSVTGFGVAADGKRALYKARKSGHIVAWSVELSKPTNEQLAGFGEIFKDSKLGTAPLARIAILKKKGRGSRFTLAKQSPLMPLSASLGEKPIFTLDKPLRIQKGRIVALTMPTWAPLYRDGLNSSENIWKASRKPDECGAEEVPNAKPQLRKGQTRTYGCKLEGERILYWAYFVPDQK